MTDPATDPEIPPASSGGGPSADVLAALCFLTATAAAVGLGVVRWQGGQTQLEGILLALTTGGIGGVGVGVVVWAKRYTPDEEVTEERKSLASTTEDLDVGQARGAVAQRCEGWRVLLGESPSTASRFSRTVSAASRSS